MSVIVKGMEMPPNCVDALANAFDLGYARGRADEEAYSLHCGDTDEPMTNGDAIRAMSDEELANMWVSYVDCGECPKHRACNMLPQDCLRHALDWLKEEVKDDNT